MKGTLAFLVVATMVIALLAELVRWIFFRRARGYVRAVVPVLLAWLLGIPLGVWSESTEKVLPHWGSVVVRYTVPAVAVAAVHWLIERHRQRKLRTTTTTV